MIIQGRCLDESALQSIRQVQAEHPDWSRRRLSIELSTQWNWRNGAGLLKDMAARSLLVKLQQRGLIELPPRRQQPSNRMRCKPKAATSQNWDQSPIQCPLDQLGTLTVSEVSQRLADRDWVAAVLGQFHYLGFSGTVGENLQYVVRDGQQRPLAVLVFGAAAWKCQARDQFLGWSIPQRQRNLSFVANNTRFLIFPWVKVPRLASWILGRVSRRLSAEWQAKYGHPIVVLESFVERQRFTGASYRAANWLAVGATKGRSRQDRYACIQVPVKEIYVYPLRHNFREALQA